MHHRIYGEHAIIDLMERQPAAVREILHAPDYRLSDTLQRVAAKHEIPLRKRSYEVLRQGAGGRGAAKIAAVIEVATPLEIADLHPETADLVIALDQVTDPHNLGAILRSAAAFGAKAVIVPRDRAAGLTDAAIRASAGAAVHIPLISVTNMARALTQLHERGYWPTAITHDTDDNLWASDLTTLPLVLVLGAEGKGIRRLVRKACPLAYRLPIEQVGSLNVSVAAALAMAEVRRQQQAKPSSSS